MNNMHWKIAALIFIEAVPSGVMNNVILPTPPPPSESFFSYVNNAQFMIPKTRKS